MNGHVINTCYAHWVLDSITLIKHSQFNLNEFEVNFLAETKSEDHLTIFGGELEHNKISFQGVRKADQKAVFDASLKTTRK